MDATKLQAKKLGIRVTRDVGETRVNKTLAELLKELKLHAKPAASKAKATAPMAKSTTKATKTKKTRRSHKTL